MEQKYRLKKDAAKFFHYSLAEKALTLDKWAEKVIPEQLLDKVERVYIQYGRGGDDYKTLRGHSVEDRETRIEFTVILSDSDSKEYEKLDIPAVMDKIQAVLNNHFIK